MVTSLFKRLPAALIAVLFALASASSFASVKALVDRNPVTLDQSFTLTLQSSEDGDPVLTPLQRDFDILSQGKSSSYQFINGQSSHTISWQIVLMAKHAGQIQIPPLSVNGESSAALALTVTAAGTNQGNASGQGSNLFLEVGAEPLTGYVQQQILLTVRLYRTVDLGQGSTLSEPKFPNANAVVEKLGQDREFQTAKNGQDYAVIERRYVIYPQKSGQFSMDPIQFDGNVVDGNQGGFFADPFNQHTSHVRTHSEPVRISVKPAPARFSGKQWLPAAALTLAENWSQDPPAFKVGEPITRTLTISAQGLTASQLPALAGDALNGFKLYPDQATLKDQPGSNGITGTREQKIALIPTRAGRLDLPAIEVKWWNTRTDKEEVAQLPARSVTVAAGQIDRNGSAPPVVQSQAPIDSGARSVAASGMRGVGGWWQWLSLALAVGWLATALAWWSVSRKKNSETATRRDADETFRKVEAKLKKVCLDNDAARATEQLLAWARLRWPVNPPASLTAMARLCAPALAEALAELDKTRYAKLQTDWRGEPFWRLFAARRPAASVSAGAGESALAPLYAEPRSTAGS